MNSISVFEFTAWAVFYINIKEFHSHNTRGITFRDKELEKPYQHLIPRGQAGENLRTSTPLLWLLLPKHDTSSVQIQAKTIRRLSYRNKPNQNWFRHFCLFCLPAPSTGTKGSCNSIKIRVCTIIKLQMDAQSRHLHLLSRVDRHIKTAAEKYTRKNTGLLRGTIPPFCQALSISNTSTLQQMQILLCKANKDKQQNKQTS